MKPWSIRKKSIVVNVVTGVVSVLVLGSVVSAVFINAIKKLELAEVESNIKQVSATYKYSTLLYEKKVVDWGEWDDSYQFIQDVNKTYIKSNISENTLENLQTDELLFYDTNAVLKYATVSAAALVNEPDFPRDMVYFFKDHSDLFYSILNSKHKSGVLKTDNGKVVYAAHPILHSDGSGPPKGVVLFARYVGEWLPDQIGSITQISVELSAENKDSIDQRYSVRHISIPVDNGDSFLYLKVTTPRNIWVEGQKVLILLIVATTLITILSILVNYFMLYRTMFLDIQKFKNEVSAIAKNMGVGNIERQGVTSDLDELRDDINYLLDILYRSKMSFENKALELDRLNKLMVGRELKMVELKEIITDLKKKII